MDSPNAGHSLAIVDIEGDKVELVAADIASETGVAAMGVRADVADSASSEEARRAIEATLGPIGGLINNAGIMPWKEG